MCLPLSFGPPRIFTGGGFGFPIFLSVSRSCHLKSSPEGRPSSEFCFFCLPRVISPAKGSFRAEQLWWIRNARVLGLGLLFPKTAPRGQHLCVPRSAYRGNLGPGKRCSWAGNACGKGRTGPEGQSVIPSAPCPSPSGPILSPAKVLC